MARRMDQRHEHLLRPQLLLPNVVFDYRVVTGEAMLISEAFEDTLGCVALLLGYGLVIIKYLIDDPHVQGLLRPVGRCIALIPGSRPLSIREV